jgi:hypothetical protein
LSEYKLEQLAEIGIGLMLKLCSTRLRNIEDTEKAKRVLFEDKAKGEEEDTFAADRCESPMPPLVVPILMSYTIVYRARRPMESDADALAKARKVAAGEAAEKQKIAGVGRRELATDDQVSLHLLLLIATSNPMLTARRQVMNRFKKRQRN